jgi:hypothetical protein
MDFNGLFQIDLSYEGPAILFDLEKANVCQGAKRFSDWTAADTEALNDLLFSELLSGG